MTGAPRNLLRQTDALTFILAPLQTEGQVLGLLGMARPMSEKFDLDEVALSVFNY